MKSTLEICSIVCLAFAMNVCGNGMNNEKLEVQMKKNANQDTTKKYLEQLNSPDAQTRSTAAVTLCKLKHPEAINACIKTINDVPDRNHFDYTPSVHCLIGVGEPALAPLIDLMNSSDENTRLHACTAIDAITYNIWKTKYTDKQTADKEWKKWWKEIGLNDEDSAKEREESIRKLKVWMSKRNKK